MLSQIYTINILNVFAKAEKIDFLWKITIITVHEHYTLFIRQINSLKWNLTAGQNTTTTTKKWIK